MRNTDRGRLSTLRNGIDALFLFGEDRASALSLTEISRRLGLPKSSVHRIVATLRDVGLLVQDPESRRYQLGDRLLSLRPASPRSELRVLALPYLRELKRRSGETAHLAELRDFHVVITQVVESSHVLRMTPRPGQAFSLHAGALARAVTAYMAPAMLRRVLEAGRFSPLTPDSPTTAEALARALKDVRRLGYAVSLQEITPGGCGISAPIFGPEGSAVASIGISGPLQRLTREKREALIGPVCRAASELGTILKGLPPRGGHRAAAMVAR